MATMRFFRLRRNLARFAQQCPASKRGRPISSQNEADLQKKGIDICEKKTRAGRTVFYKTGKQLEKEKKEKTQRGEERKKVGAKAKGRLSKISRGKIEELRQKLSEIAQGLEKVAGKKEIVAAEVQKAAIPQDKIVRKSDKAVEFEKLGWIPKSVIESYAPLKIKKWFVEKEIKEGAQNYHEVFPEYKPLFQAQQQKKQYENQIDVLTYKLDVSEEKQEEIIKKALGLDDAGFEKRIKSFLDGEAFSPSDWEKITKEAGIK